jgi:hypothetical protein
VKRNLLLVAYFALLASSAFGAGSQAVPVYTFVCNGNKTGPCPDGASPNSLILASDGNYYGTAANSGTKAGGETLFGGTIFSLTPAGKFTLLHTFAPGSNKNFSNGAAPTSLTEGPDGLLYGLTAEGGVNFGGQFYGYGVLFRIAKTGSGFRVIHKFCSVDLYICKDGAYPSGPLAVGTDGNIYGTTAEGGTGSGCPQPACGTVFRVTPSTGAYEVVVSLSLMADGELPGRLGPEVNGTFYGVGFSYTPATNVYQTITTSFPFPTGCPGSACFATPTFALGPNGNMYGLYSVYDLAGDSGLYEAGLDGSDFQLFPVFTTVNGGSGELLLASDSNFWAPQSTGSSTYGDILTLSPTDGTLIQTLTPFDSVVSNPVEIIEAADGTLWGVGAGTGTVSGSGHFSGGTVFTLNAGLAPK